MSHIERTVENGGRVGSIGPAEDGLAVVTEYWRTLGEGSESLPVWSRFDLAVVPRHLIPWLSVLEVTVMDTGSPAMVFKVVGEEVKRATGRNIAGLAVDADLYGSEADRFIRTFQSCLDSRRPLWMNAAFHRRSAYNNGQLCERIVFTSLLLPFAVDGRRSKILILNHPELGHQLTGPGEIQGFDGPFAVTLA